MLIPRRPAAFRHFAGIAIPLTALLGAVLLAAGWAIGLNPAWSPADYQQGELVRILYVHVPTAWGATAIFAGMAVAAAIAFVTKGVVAASVATAAAPVGAAITALCLVTGALWGSVTWGTYWVWDARLTSVLVLFFLYLLVMALGAGFDDRSRAQRAAGLATLIGAVNIPVVKFSVDWFQTLHQGRTILREGGSALAPQMMTPLLLAGLGLALLCAAFILVRIRTALDRQRLEALAARA